MTGGSTEKESPFDKQCSNCDLWYMDKGVSFSMHEAACDGTTTSTQSTGGASTQQATSEPASPSSTTQSATGGLQFPDNPDSGGQGASMSDSVDLPCGHESFDPDDVPDSAIEDGKTTVTCSECGDTREVTL